MVLIPHRLRDTRRVFIGRQPRTRNAIYLPKVWVRVTWYSVHSGVRAGIPLERVRHRDPSGPSLVSTTSHPARPARARVANKFWIPSASRASFLSAARTDGDRPGNGLRCWTELIRRVKRSQTSPNFRPYRKTGLRRAKTLKCFVATTVAALTLQL